MKFNTIESNLEFEVQHHGNHQHFFTTGIIRVNGRNFSAFMRESFFGSMIVSGLKYIDNSGIEKLIRDAIDNPPDLSDVNAEFETGRLILSLPLKRLEEAFKGLTTQTMRQYTGYISPGYILYSASVLFFEYLNNNVTSFFKRIQLQNNYFIERAPRISDELFESLMLGCFPFLYYSKTSQSELQLMNIIKPCNHFFKFDPSPFLIKGEPKWHPDLMIPRIVMFHKGSIAGIIQNNIFLTKKSKLWETAKAIALFQARFSVYHTNHTFYTHGHLIRLYENVQDLNKVHPRDSILYFMNNLFLNNHQLLLLFGNVFFDSNYRNLFNTSEPLTYWIQSDEIPKLHLTSYDYFMMEMPELTVPYKTFILKLYAIIHKFIKASFPDGKTENYTEFWQKIKEKFKVHSDSHDHIDILSRVIMIIIEHSAVHNTMEGSSDSSLAPFLMFKEHDKLKKYSPQKYQQLPTWPFTSLIDILPKVFLSSFVEDYNVLLDEFKNVQFVKSYDLKSISARVDS
jgi:hypothetical protein